MKQKPTSENYEEILRSEKELQCHCQIVIYQMDS